MTKLRRRDVIFRTMQLAAIAVVPAIGSRSRAENACVDPSSESFRNSLQYTDPAPDPEKACGACGFFTASGESACGNCIIMSGPVNQTAWCDSWSPKG